MAPGGKGVNIIGTKLQQVITNGNHPTGFSSPSLAPSVVPSRGLATQKVFNNESTGPVIDIQGEDMPPPRPPPLPAQLTWSGRRPLVAPCRGSRCPGRQAW